MASARRRPVLAALAALAGALTAGGCVSMPSGGPVRSYSVTQAADAQSQQYVQMVPQAPARGWSPTQIVQGFLTASASFGDQGNEVAQEYLTPGTARSWTPPRSAIVYKEGPDVPSTATPAAGAKNTVTVRIAGQVQAYLKGNGSYSVPSASARNAVYSADQNFTLVKQGNGQWRISVVPQELLLTTDSFNNDYQLRSLYFFDPSHRYLVADPVYVPLLASEEVLMNGLVQDLIEPPADWLSGGATQTALPTGTKLAGVTLDGVTAVVNLAGTVTKSSAATLQNISDQLAWTLSGVTPGGTSGQSVQSVQLEVNGKAWHPQGNPAQPGSSRKKPPTGASTQFYYVDTAGFLDSRAGVRGKPARVEQVGGGVTQLAVSPDGRYVALLRGTTLYTGLIGSPLGVQGAGYKSLSWDVSDNLWAVTGGRVYLFHGSRTGSQPLQPKVAVDVSSDDGVPDQSGPFYQLKVAPDGVRVAIVMDTDDDGYALTIGAIVGQQGGSPQITLSQVQLTPKGGALTFSALSWYGADDVITLAGPGPVATEYAVSGGSATAIPVDSDMTSITASWGNPLIATLPGRQLAGNASLSGAWTDLGAGSAPVYPG